MALPLTAFALLTLGASQAFADPAPNERPFCANRPGLNTPPCVLDKGRWQIETGVSFTNDQAGSNTTKTWNVGGFTLRYGVTPILEAQVSWTPYVVIQKQSPGSRTIDSGSGAVTFAIRRSLVRPDGSGVSAAIQPFVSLPTGSEAISGSGWQPGVALPVSAPLGGNLRLSLTPQATIIPNLSGGGHHVAYGSAAGVSGSAGKVGWAVDIAAYRDLDSSGAATQVLGALSAAWAPATMPDTQFDVGTSIGLNSHTPDVSISFGLAKRY
ncbi:MAG: transporter [Caulobacteraceae bacterium]